MIYDAQRRRYLNPTGHSIWTLDRAVEHLFDKGELPEEQLVESNFDSIQYDFLNGTSCSININGEEYGLKPLRAREEDLPQKDVIPEIMDRIESSPRYIEYPNRKRADDRLEQELNFYFENGYAGFLVQLADLVDRFKREGVVWGVGRGSSCASFVLYVLEVHDIDPIEFEIDFRELSKEEPTNDGENID